MIAAHSASVRPLWFDELSTYFVASILSGFVLARLQARWRGAASLALVGITYTSSLE